VTIRALKQSVRLNEDTLEQAYECSRDRRSAKCESAKCVHV